MLGSFQRFPLQSISLLSTLPLRIKVSFSSPVDVIVFPSSRMDVSYYEQVEVKADGKIGDLDDRREDSRPANRSQAGAMS